MSTSCSYVQAGHRIFILKLKLISGLHFVSLAEKIWGSTHTSKELPKCQTGIWQICEVTKMLPWEICSHLSLLQVLFSARSCVNYTKQTNKQTNKQRQKKTNNRVRPVDIRQNSRSFPIFPVPCTRPIYGKQTY